MVCDIAAVDLDGINEEKLLEAPIVRRVKYDQQFRNRALMDAQGLSLELILCILHITSPLGCFSLTQSLSSH